MRKQTLKLIGQRFGHVVVTAKGTKPSYWVCNCDCGNVFETRGTRLKNSITTSCGCIRKKHGHTSGGITPTYQSWKSLKARCNNSRIKSHGGRGIRYDPRWEEFPAFLKDMGERPEDKSIDRIDVMGNYSKANCRWATDEVQANNKRGTRVLYYDLENCGAGGSPAEWARFLREMTDNGVWTVRHLESVLRGLSLDQIVGAVHPFRPTPRELEERAREGIGLELNAKFVAMTAPSMNVI
jgi:hypothetical protein